MAMADSSRNACAKLMNLAFSKRGYRPRRYHAPLVWALLLTLLFQFSNLHAQPASAPNRVAARDGTNSYVRLPDDILHTFTEGTVEAWVRPSHWNGIQRYFNFGTYQHDMGAGRPWNAQLGLQFFMSPDPTFTH